MWLKDICRLLTVAGASHAQVLEAIENVQFKDFEDCAGMAKADGLKFVTHDYKISFYE